MLVKKSLERRERRRVNQIIQIAVDQITQIAIILDLYPQGMLTNNKRNNFFLNFIRLNKLILILSFISISCNDNTITESVEEITRTSIPDTSIENYTISQELIADTLDIKNSIEYVSMGSIQGLDTSDKLYMVSFINKEFYGKNSFEVYCLPKIKFKELYFKVGDDYYGVSIWDSKKRQIRLILNMLEENNVIEPIDNFSNENDPYRQKVVRTIKKFLSEIM
jgi:hypothetical protein